MGALPKLLLSLVFTCAAHAEFLRIEVSMKDMNCLSCSDSMGKAFERMRGVKRVDVNAEKGTVALELAEQNRVTIEQVWDTIKRIGFTPGDTTVTVRGSVSGDSLKISVIDKVISLEGRATDGENVELKGTITPPPDPRTPMKLRL
jgi:copper chaperone CopZ